MNVNISDYGALLTLIIFAGGIVLSAGGAQYQLHSQQTRLSEIEIQQKQDHDIMDAMQIELAEIRVDVRWIRKELERDPEN
jgi:sensor domain CHASE-containing protein